MLRNLKTSSCNTLPTRSDSSMLIPMHEELFKPCISKEIQGHPRMLKRFQGLTQLYWKFPGQHPPRLNEPKHEMHVPLTFNAFIVSPAPVLSYYCLPQRQKHFTISDIYRENNHLSVLWTQRMKYLIDIPKTQDINGLLKAISIYYQGGTKYLRT